MDLKKITQELKKQYPGKKIIPNHKTNPTEILCEIDSAQSHPGYSSAISIIDQTAPHYHERSAEIYYVLKGKLELFVEGARYTLTEDQYRVIPPGKIHFAKGKATWVLVYSEPGWQKQDHLEVKEKPSEFLPTLTHIRLLVNNYSAMFNFYQQTLGLTVAWGKPDGNYAEFETGEARIAIYRQEKMPKIIQDKLSKNRPMSLINLQVEDLKSAVAFLQEKKLSFLVPATRYPESGIESVYFEDPEGNILEIYSDLQ